MHYSVINASISTLVRPVIVNLCGEKISQNMGESVQWRFSFYCSNLDIYYNEPDQNLSLEEFQVLYEVNLSGFRDQSQRK